MRWRWVLGAYVAVSGAYLITLGMVAVGTIVRHQIAVDSEGGLAAVDFPHGWVAVIEHLVLPVNVAFWLLFIARHVQAWRRSGGERRQQLKWLASGAAVSLAAITYTVVGPALDPHAPPGGTGGAGVADVRFPPAPAHRPAP